MPFTAAEIENVFNATIDFHDKKPKVARQDRQKRPLLDFLDARKENFPGGKDVITVRAKGGVSVFPQGLSGDDVAQYSNPTNIKTASYPWMFIHNGIKFTKHELAKNGITVNDTTTGEGTSQKSESEMVQLANVVKEKLEELDEGQDRGMNLMLWRDGTQDALEIPGLTSFILDNPNAASVVAGIDPNSNTWWKNRASVGFA